VTAIHRRAGRETGRRKTHIGRTLNESIHTNAVPLVAKAPSIAHLRSAPIKNATRGPL
jgi:hypothetical protein